MHVHIVIISFVLLSQVYAGMYLSSYRNNDDTRDFNNALYEIERKLQYLENTACSSSLDAKLDQFNQKIANIEKQMTHLEHFVRLEVEKIAENISTKIFNDDLDADRITRKIDTVYERINRKLIGIETQLELNSVKMQNGKEMLMSKLDKMEERMMIRDADMEAELTDAIAAIDDLKTSNLNIEDAIFNHTKDIFKILSKNNEKTNRKHQLHVSSLLEDVRKNLTENLHGMRENTEQLLNVTGLRLINQTRKKVEENLNEYANKMTNIYEELLKNNEKLHKSVETIGKMGNLSRSEQQNGLRALMVEVGRKTGKKTELAEANGDEQLRELSEKIDANFESVMMAQNMFLDNCHRIQMDEPQLESKISQVLEKLIDTFEKMSLVKTSDVEAVKRSLNNHDSMTKHKLHYLEHKFVNLLQQNAKISEQILDAIKIDQDHLHQSIQNGETRENRTQQLTKGILKQLEDIEEKLNSGGNHTKQQIQNIQHILNGLESKINKSYLDYYFNKYNIEFITHRFGKQLHQYLHSIELNDTNNFHKFENENKTNQLILEIFGHPSNTSYKQNNQDLIDFCNKTFHPDINVRFNDFGSNFSISDCDQLYNTTFFTAEKPQINQTEEKPIYTNLIDARFGEMEETNETTTFNQIDYESTTETGNMEESFPSTSEAEVAQTNTAPSMNNMEVTEESVTNN